MSYIESSDRAEGRQFAYSTQMSKLVHDSVVLLESYDHMNKMYINMNRPTD